MHGCNCNRVSGRLSAVRSSGLENGPFGPSGFGPSMWFTMHSGAAERAIMGGYLTENEKAAWESWLRNLWVCIPCESCRRHYIGIVNAVDFGSVNTGDKVFRLTVDIHNMVNARLNKQHVTLQKAICIYGLDTKLGPASTITFSANTSTFN